MMTVSTVAVTLPTDREVSVVRDFQAPPPMVFKALTVPELVLRWMHGPNGWRLEVCEIDLRPGGAFRYVWRKPGGREMGLSGVYRDVEPPVRMVHTEQFDEDWTGGETEVTTTLTAIGAITRLTVTVLYASKDARDAALETNFVTGMEAGYNAMADLLAAGIVE